MGAFVDKSQQLSLGDVPEASPGSMYSSIRDIVDRSSQYVDNYSEVLQSALDKLGNMPEFILDNIQTGFSNVNITDMNLVQKPLYTQVNDVGGFEVPDEPNVDVDDDVRLENYAEAPNTTFNTSVIKANDVQKPAPFVSPTVDRANSPGYASINIPIESLVLSPVDSLSYTDISDDLQFSPIDTSAIDSFVFPDSNVVLRDYLSDIEPKLIPKLLDELDTGSHGISESIFNSIIDMEIRKRSLIEIHDRERLLDTIGSDGFDLPQGILVSVLNEFDQVVTAKNHDTIDSTRIMNAELAQKNTDNVRSLLLEAEKVFSTRFVSIEELKIKVASHFAEIAVAKFNSLRERILLGYEDIKNQIEKKRISIDIAVANNKSRFDSLQTELEKQKLNIEAVANRNNFEVEAAKAMATIEDINASIFKVIQAANVDEARFHLEALKTESDVYSSAVDAERSRVGIELEVRKLEDERESLKLEIYRIENQAVSEKNKGLLQELQSKISIADNKIKLFSALVAARGDSKKIELAIEGMKSDVNKTLASIYDTEVRAEVAKYQGSIDKAKFVLNKETQEVQVALSMENSRLQAFTSEQQLRQEAIKAHATLATQSVASAWGAINVSLGYSYTGNESVSAQRSISNSLSNTMQESHSYTEE